MSQSMISNAAVHHHKETVETNYALSFDGSGDHIVVNGGTISNAWSFEVWFKKAGNRSGINLTNQGNSNNSGTWSLRLGQWKNIHKVGITKYGVKDYYINNSKANLPIGKWSHVAWTYQNNLVTVYVNGESLGSTFSRGPLSNGAKLHWNIIGKGNSLSIYGEIDEVRVWNDKRTASEIADNMFLELTGNEANLVAYYKMSNGSGTTVDDDSSNNKNGTMTNMNNQDWVTSHIPLGELNDNYKTNIKSIWKATGTSSSFESDGLSMSVSSELAEQNFVVFGNNGSTSTTTNDIPAGITKRSARVFQFDLTGSVSANIKIDIGDVTGFSGTPGATSNYKLLFRPIGCTGSCDYSILATAASVSSTDIFEFTNISIQDGYYAIGSTDSNL